jgi:hypothetical protein
VRRPPHHDKPDGSDLTVENDPFQVTDLERLVEPQEADYISKSPLEVIRARGVSRKPVGIGVAGTALPFELSRKCDALSEGKPVAPDGATWPARTAAIPFLDPHKDVPKS